MWLRDSYNGGLLGDGGASNFSYSITSGILVPGGRYFIGERRFTAVHQRKCSLLAC